LALSLASPLGEERLVDLSDALAMLSSNSFERLEIKPHSVGELLP
jgi:hypothetical protein